MQKNVNLCVDLKTVMQNDALPVEGLCYNGVLTRDGQDHFIFEESWASIISSLTADISLSREIMALASLESLAPTLSGIFP